MKRHVSIRPKGLAFYNIITHGGQIISTVIGSIGARLFGRAYPSFRRDSRFVL